MGLTIGRFLISTAIMKEICMLPPNLAFTGMTRRQSSMSLWNLSLEIHTGRFFQFLLGDFYILIVPLVGLAAIMVIISGYLL